MREGKLFKDREKEVIKQYINHHHFHLYTYIHIYLAQIPTPHVRYVFVCRLELLEAGAHDPSKFLKWQNEMRQKDLDAELATIERRRIEGKLSHEEAILARQKLISTNQKRVEKMKQETRELMKR